MWRRTYDHWGYSPLGQIDASNVGNLRLAWGVDHGAGPSGNDTAGARWDHVPPPGVRLHRGSGRPGRNAHLGIPAPRGWTIQRTLACANRNAVLYGNRLFIATHDAYLVALDARSGEVEWESQVGDWTVGQHYSGGPQIIRGRVVAGMSGCYHINTGCWISAHDPETGEELWRTHTLAQPGEPGYASWGDVPEEDRRGGSAWIAPSYDPELGLIYVGVAVPIPWGSLQRGSGDGDVLYTNSTLALNADTGEIEWYFQHLPGGEWDLDHPFERILVETEVAPDPDAVEWINPALRPGERRKVVTGLPGKPGVVWTLDAATGDFLWARPTNFQNVIVGVDAENREGIANAALKPSTIGEAVLVCPHLSGGINWQAVAYSPQTNALYAPTNNTCMNYTLNEVEPTLGRHHGSATSERVHVPDSEEQVGQLTAVDLVTGATRWEHRQRAGIGGSVSHHGWWLSVRH